MFYILLHLFTSSFLFYIFLHPFTSFYKLTYIKNPTPSMLHHPASTVSGSCYFSSFSLLTFLFFVCTGFPSFVNFRVFADFPVDFTVFVDFIAFAGFFRTE